MWRVKVAPPVTSSLASSLIRLQLQHSSFPLLFPSSSRPLPFQHKKRRTHGLLATTTGIQRYSASHFRCVVGGESFFRFSFFIFRWFFHRMSGHAGLCRGRRADTTTPITRTTGALPHCNTHHGTYPLLSRHHGALR